MVSNILIWLVLVAVVAAFGWLTLRARRAKNVVVKWAGLLLAGLVTIILALVSVAIGRGLYLLYVPRDNPVANISVERTPEQIARGEHLAATVCATCHDPDGELPLSGGRNLSEDAKLALGDLYPPNLTPAGPMATLSDGDVWRIFRDGVPPTGRQALMPVNRLQNLSDDDLKAVIAYIRSQQPAARRGRNLAAVCLSRSTTWPMPSSPIHRHPAICMRA